MTSFVAVPDGMLPENGDVFGGVSAEGAAVVSAVDVELDPDDIPMRLAGTGAALNCAAAGKERMEQIAATSARRA